MLRTDTEDGKHKLQLFKLQLPIETNDIPPLALVYNQDRSISFHTPVDKIHSEVMDEFLQKGWIADRFKCYVAGFMHEGMFFVCTDLTTQEDQDQPW